MNYKTLVSGKKSPYIKYTQIYKVSATLTYTTFDTIPFKPLRTLAFDLSIILFNNNKVG